MTRRGGGGPVGDVARFFVPGRIEVLGKHTDYAGGRSLLTAVSRGLTVEADPGDDDATIRVRATDAGQEASFRVRREGGRVRAEPIPPAREPGGWYRYAVALVPRLAAHFGGRLRGARIAFGGDLPPASGLSSSSALVTGLFLGLDAVCRFREDARFLEHLPDRESLAAYLADIERGTPVPGLDDPATTPASSPAAPRGAGRRGPERAERARGAEGPGTRGGAEDHTAILCAEEGRVVRYGFEPVRRLGSVVLPGSWTFVVACSGVTAEKAGAARAPYNRLSDLARDAAAAWRAATGGAEPTLGDALAAAGDGERLVAAVAEGARGRGGDPEPLAGRARHFAREVALVDDAFRAIETGDADALGETVDRSQALAERLLLNQVPETIGLCRSARDRGAIAASAFGAGFGGAVWALVEADAARAFLADWERRYADDFPRAAARATFFVTGAAPPAGPLPPPRRPRTR